MDGNRRWAKARGLPTLEGHRRGYDKLKEVGEWCLEAGIKYLTVYGFSTENWQRSKEEVDYLMALIHDAVTKEIQHYQEKKIRLKVIGRREGLSARLVQAFEAAEQATAGNDRCTLTLAINYGGRAELVDAVNRLCHPEPAEGSRPKLMEADMNNALYAPDIPNPNLIIRTSGEQRLSGFLTWQSVYSELYFETKHWPDFEKVDFDRILAWYADREQRYGK